MPRCDCVHIPSAEDTADEIRTDPKKTFAAMTADEQDKVFGKAGARAIRAGADMSQVVNARKGMYTASVGGQKVAATTAGSRIRSTKAIRLMPEQIFRQADGDRDEAIRLLRRFGYLR